jgi:hypothetical protein
LFAGIDFRCRQSSLAESGTRHKNDVIIIPELEKRKYKVSEGKLSRRENRNNNTRRKVKEMARICPADIDGQVQKIPYRNCPAQSMEEGVGETGGHAAPVLPLETPTPCPVNLNRNLSIE